MMPLTGRSNAFGAPAARGRSIPREPIVLGRTGLLGSHARLFKRVFDLMVVALLGLLALVPGVLIALAIAIDSRGPVFFAHRRVGEARRSFRLWKFRSMVGDADALLERYLRHHPERASEWDRTHKLKDDPRVTRVGHFLRKTSLDELPQLWNVLRGDMSMVGPRPIVAAEAAKYGPAFGLYTQVLPGLTGLWQVSGRNDTQYSRRVELDCHYIRNWSAARDLAILFRTAGVIVRGRGAY